jgi:hypothetical protein
VNFAQLWEEPEKYRGQLIHIEGLVRRVRKFDAPRQAAAEGVPVLYEGWIFAEHQGSNPYCVIVSELGEGVPIAESISGCRVSFDGYFFKRYRYQADKWRDAPLLIGRAVIKAPGAIEGAEEDTSGFGRQLFPAVLIFLGAMVAFALGITVWFRRADKRAWARIRQVRDSAFVEPQPPAAP